MFADWELVGIPQRVVISDRGLKGGTVELQGRREAVATVAPLTDAALDPALQASRGDFVARTDAVLALCEAIALRLETSTAAAGSADAAAAPAAIDLQVMELTYEALKAALLAAGAAGRLPLAEMEEALRRFSAIRRATQQAAKAAQRQMHRSDT